MPHNELITNFFSQTSNILHYDSYSQTQYTTLFTFELMLLHTFLITPQRILVCGALGNFEKFNIKVESFIPMCSIHFYWSGARFLCESETRHCGCCARKPQFRLRERVVLTRAYTSRYTQLYPTYMHQIICTDYYNC